MKIYKKKTTFNIYLFLSLILLGVGLVTLTVTALTKKHNLMYMPLAVLPVLFVCIFFAFYEKNCSVLLADKLIYIGHKSFSDDEKYNKASLTLKFSEIERITVRYYRVQGKRPLDENKYTFLLKDGSEIRTYFYEYGEKSEKEILDFLKSKVKVDY